ncbi:MAG: EAL domain-containing protein [Hydrogenovibrio sp.]|uniref:EAL domain-containing protein n=1 Tax=Hydrogenovibrio sp. TaxID=2065821 RepID=UPI00287023AD|nr:EAL domain-containing protein [Hydrogenovibrio sp.]MDR9498391.1 EAL domain-containing protein [Hydrogenovibrio sp.]
MTTLFLVVLVGTFILQLNSTRQFLANQLTSHAQDTATSLGLSLTSVADPDDPSTMETMINAVFDRGYYSHITLRDRQEEVLYQRTNSQQIEGIPDWFIQAVAMEAPKSHALIQSGWMPIGELTVQSHPGYAYSELWQTFKQLLAWFALVALLAIALAIGAIRLMLEPLKRMERQAQAIVKKEYILQDPLPKTHEFKQVVHAMNAMVEKMKVVFERDAQNAQRLQKLAYEDAVTGLSNRNHFEMNVAAMLDPKNDAPSGAMVMIHIEGLKTLNDRLGYMAGDKLMKGIGQAMTDCLGFDGAFLARLNGTDLVALIPNVSGSELTEPVSRLLETFPGLLRTLQAESLPTYLAVAYMDYQPGQTRPELLASLDYGLQQASSMGPNQAYYHRHPSSDQPALYWEKESDLRAALVEQRFLLFQQPVVEKETVSAHQELLIRLQDQDKTIHSAGFFMPAIQRLGLEAELDRHVINLAKAELRQGDNERVFDINLSLASLTDSHAWNQFLQQLDVLTDCALAFEVPERAAVKSPETAQKLADTLRKWQKSFGLDQFGSRFTDMSYLQTLRPDYLKLDAALTKAIEKDPQTQDYIQSLVEMSQSLDITLIATSVETEAQINAFEALGVNRFQGYYFGVPTPLTSDPKEEAHE